MEKRDEEIVFFIWVDWKNRVISFSKGYGFEELRFQTHEEKCCLPWKKEMKDLDSSKEDAYETLHKRKSFFLG